MNTENQDLQRTSYIEEGKTIAIISYITVIGLIIALILNNDKKNLFGSITFCVGNFQKALTLRYE